MGEQLPPQIRRTLGWTLLAVGALSTVPIAFEVFGRRNGKARDRVVGGRNANGEFDRKAMARLPP